jgi:hypothetical protein
VNKTDAAWLTFWAGFGVLDYAADRKGKSLCTSARHLFRTDRPGGKLAFTAAFGTGALVLFAHVVKEQRRADD